ncbi:MAG TPA: PilZ domain-containing protein [Thermoanaerobaculia bacterium]|nr:PilZ domain-containing protein [Thermoanaerobaculia bacterium]
MKRPIRRFPRIEADTLAYVKILGDRRREKIAWVKVLAAGGCMLVCDDTIGFRSLMELRITLGNRELRADGRVAWEARHGAREHHVGIEFLRIGQADRAAIEALVAASGAAA